MIEQDLHVLGDRLGIGPLGDGSEREDFIPIRKCFEPRPEQLFLFFTLPINNYLDLDILQSGYSAHVNPEGKNMFGLSHSAGYAILALSCLERSSGRWVVGKKIGDATTIPRPYLLKILHVLLRTGLLQTKRGYQGGFQLAKPAGKISLWEIAAAIDGPEFLNRCLLGLADCRNGRACPTHEFWSAERPKIKRVLRETTLADIAEFEWKWRYGKPGAARPIRERKKNR